MNVHQKHPKPSIKDLGVNLLELTLFQLLATLIVPFIFLTLYFIFAENDVWIAAVFCTIGLSFTTYGSTSHDLVHNNLKLHTTLNTVILSILELACFRSGHAYKLSHLHHHKRYPHEDDIEGAASRMSFLRTLLEGIIFQFRIYSWALIHFRNHKYHRLVVLEGLIILGLTLFCVYSISFTNCYFIFMCIMIAGSWIIPLITSSEGKNELHQTRLFRGHFFSIIAFNHLFHLEHHLYPMVPHKNWPKLARRLDEYFQTAGIKPLEIKF